MKKANILKVTILTSFMMLFFVSDFSFSDSFSILYEWGGLYGNTQISFNLENLEALFQYNVIENFEVVDENKTFVDSVNLPNFVTSVQYKNVLFLKTYYKIGLEIHYNSYYYFSDISFVPLVGFHLKETNFLAVLFKYSDREGLILNTFSEFPVEKDIMKAYVKGYFSFYNIEVFLGSDFRIFFAGDSKFLGHFGIMFSQGKGIIPNLGIKIELYQLIISSFLKFTPVIGSIYEVELTFKK